MPPPLFTTIEGRFPIARHEHVAALYRGPSAEGFRFAPFLAEGLERRDRCVCLAPKSFHQAMLPHLRSRTSRLDEALETGALRLFPGMPELAALRDYVQQAFADAERLRSPGVRWLEEGSWAEAARFPMQQFFEFHAVLNYQVKQYPSVALCQYALDELPPHDLFSALAVHRHLLVEETFVRDNPFYIPAERFISLNPQDRDRDLARVFREVGFDTAKLLEALAGYGRLRADSTSEPAR